MSATTPLFHHIINSSTGLSQTDTITTAVLVILGCIVVAIIIGYIAYRRNVINTNAIAV
jgi:hypothetical protein